MHTYIFILQILRLRLPLGSCVWLFPSVFFFIIFILIWNAKSAGKKCRPRPRKGMAVQIEVQDQDRVPSRPIPSEIYNCE